MLNSGDFNKKITLKKRVITIDELMQEVEDLVDCGTFWTNIKTTRSSEAIIAGNLSSLNEKRFILRYSKKLNDLLTSDKTHFALIFKGAEYNVKSAINDNEENVTVTIVAEGRV